MNATVSALQERIHRSIPLSAAMDFHIIELSSSYIRAQAPLEPNINIHATAFAGSIYSAATLSAWALLTHILSEHMIDAELVIASAEIKYRAPVNEDIRCLCELPEQDIQLFLDKLINRKKSRIEGEVLIGDLPEARLKVVLFARINN